MGIEDKFDRFSLESYQFQGEVREYMKQTSNYIKAVSDNVKVVADDIKHHSTDNEAHALSIREKGGERWISILAVGIAAIAAVGELFRMK